MILSEKEVDITSVRMPPMYPAACLVVAGYEVDGMVVDGGILGSMGRYMAWDQVNIQRRYIKMTARPTTKG